MEFYACRLWSMKMHFATYSYNASCFHFDETNFEKKNASNKKRKKKQFHNTYA